MHGNALGFYLKKLCQQLLRNQTVSSSVKKELNFQFQCRQCCLLMEKKPIDPLICCHQFILLAGVGHIEVISEEADMSIDYQAGRVCLPVKDTTGLRICFKLEAMGCEPMVQGLVLAKSVSCHCPILKHDPAKCLLAVIVKLV